jgi:D-glycero-D-manno-heptose 1,7-bisphosphate phosphatase
VTPALFLDRDGVLIDEVQYLSRPDQVRLVPGAAAAVGRAARNGWKVVVVTNQSGVARGLLPEERLADIHAELARQLAAESARMDGIYYCPHHPTAGVGEYLRDCDCRKPRPGMLQAAARDFGIDLGRSVLVGDRRTDLEAGLAAGCRVVLVRTGYGLNADISGLGVLAVADDLPAAVNVIAGQEGWA